jgi:hypothetical protein
MNSGTEAIEATTAQDNDNRHENQSEFGFVDTVVHPCELQTYPVIERPRDGFTNNTQDEGRQRCQARFAYRKVVWW